MALRKYEAQAAAVNGQLKAIKVKVDEAITYFESVGTSLPAPSDADKEDLLSKCTRVSAGDIAKNLGTISALCQGIPSGLSAKAKELDDAEEAERRARELETASAPGVGGTNLDETQ